MVYERSLWKIVLWIRFVPVCLRGWEKAVNKAECIHCQDLMMSEVTCQWLTVDECASACVCVCAYLRVWAPDWLWALAVLRLEGLVWNPWQGHSRNAHSTVLFLPVPSSNRYNRSFFRTSQWKWGTAVCVCAKVFSNKIKRISTKLLQTELSLCNTTTGTITLPLNKLHIGTDLQFTGPFPSSSLILYYQEGFFRQKHRCAMGSPNGYPLKSFRDTSLCH